MVAGNVSTSWSLKERIRLPFLLMSSLATLLLESWTRKAGDVPFIVTWDIIYVSAGKTCQHDSYRIQEISAQEFWGWNLRGLWVWQNRIQWAHSAAEISNYNCDTKSTGEHLDRGRRQGQFLLAGWFHNLTNVTKGENAICRLMFLKVHCFFHRAGGCALVPSEDLWVRQMFSQSSHVRFWARRWPPSKCPANPLHPFLALSMCQACALFHAAAPYDSTIHIWFPLPDSRLSNEKAFLRRTTCSWVKGLDTGFSKPWRLFLFELDSLKYTWR